MKINLAGIFSVLAVGALAFTATPSAHATAELELISGASSVIITDGGVNDANSLTGAITFSGTVGTFDISITTTGITKPVLGSATSPSLDLNSIQVSSGVGNLTILFSDVGFGPTSGSFLGQIGGTINNGGGSLSYATFVNTSNTELAISGPGTTQLTSQGPFAPGAFSGTTTSGILAMAGPYSLTQEVVISHSTGGNTSFNASLTTTVPDGGSTVALLGAVLVGFEALRRKFMAA
jgi:hypothetical protein